MDEEIMYFNSEEEISEALKSTDREMSKKVTAAIMEDRYVIGERPATETVGEAADSVVEEQVDTVQEVAVEPVPIASDISIELEEQNQKIRQMYEKSYAEKEAEMQRKIDEMNTRLKSYEDEKAKVVDTLQTPVVDLDEEDPDFASAYSRNTRKLFEAELAAIKSKVETPEILEELNAIKQRLAEEDRREAEAQAAKEAEVARIKMLTELEKLTKGKAGLELPIALIDAREEQNTFKVRMAEALNLSDKNEIERAYRRVITEDSAWARAQKQKLTASNLAVPEYSKNYLNIVEVYELQKGARFNTATGVYEDAILSLEDAYKLKNFNTIISQAGANEAKEIQKKLDAQHNSATVLSNSVTSDASGTQAYTNDEIVAATRMKPSDLVKNKVLAKKYANFLRDGGYKVPPILQNI
jgi:hypothetical protein